MKNALRCILLVALSATALPSVAIASPDHFETRRPDGSTIDWYLDKPKENGKTGLIVMAQGSGCLSVLHNENLLASRSAFSEFAVLFVEKYGVKPRDNPKDDHRDCSASFYNHHTVSQRVADYKQVIGQLRGEPWWNGDLVLFGGSEGGMVSGLLAEQAKPGAVILISTGAGVTFGQMVKQSFPKENWPMVDEGFAKARQKPTSNEVLAGQSLRFWADAIDRRIVDNMLRTDTTFLLIQGGRDAPIIVDAARAASSLFATAGRCNLTYWEYPGYNHGMIDGAGNSNMDDVLSQSAEWVRHQLSGRAKHPACMTPN